MAGDLDQTAQASMAIGFFFLNMTNRLEPKLIASLHHGMWPNFRIHDLHAAFVFLLTGFVIVFYHGRRDQISNLVHVRDATGYVYVKIITFEIGLTWISHRIVCVCFFGWIEMTVNI